MRMSHRMMEFTRTDCHEEVDGIDYDDDEEAMLARVLLESQNSFLLEQQNIYQRIVAPDTEVDRNTPSVNVDFVAPVDNTKYNHSFSQWYDYRHYNSIKDVSSDQRKACASMDGHNYDEVTQCAIKEIEHDMKRAHICDDSNDFEQFQSFPKRHSRRQRFRSSCNSSSENNYNKMPSQSSIFVPKPQ
jgi:hypothetical protein